MSFPHVVVLSMALATTAVHSAASHEPTIEILDSEHFLDALPEHLLYIYSDDPGTPAGAAEAIGDRFWIDRKSIKVCYFGANPVIVKLIASSAGDWQEALGDRLILDFGSVEHPRSCLDQSDGFFQIRVGFGDRGYYSMIGKDSEQQSDRQPSMNLAGFNRKYSPAKAGLTISNVAALAEPRDKGIIRHEFGHALGLLHEHQNPNFDCSKAIIWEGENGLISFGKRQWGWEEDRIRRNFEYVSNVEVSPIGDITSIMVYGLNPAYIKEEYRDECVFPQPLIISRADKAFIAAQYRGPAWNNDAILIGRVSPKRQLSSILPEDTLRRALVDLKSMDEGTRAFASHRLANILDDLSETQVSRVFEILDRGPLHAKRAVVGAMANAPGFKLSEQHQLIISRVANASADPMLSASISQLPQRGWFASQQLKLKDMSNAIEYYMSPESQQKALDGMTLIIGQSPLKPANWKDSVEL